MAKSKILYQEKVGIYAKYHHPGSDDFLEYNATIQIKDLGKQPIIAKMKFNGLVPSTEDAFRGRNRLTEQQAEFIRHLFLRLMPKA